MPNVPPVPSLTTFTEAVAADAVVGRIEDELVADRRGLHAGGFRGLVQGGSHLCGRRSRVEGEELASGIPADLQDEVRRKARRARARPKSCRSPCSWNRPSWLLARRSEGKGSAVFLPTGVGRRGRCPH